jgi:hypothetical protein
MQEWKPLLARARQSSQLCAVCLADGNPLSKQAETANGEFQEGGFTWVVISKHKTAFGKFYLEFE